MTTIKLFPKIEAVFVDNTDLNRKHFMPLATFDLSEIDENLSGLIHLVYYNIDPYCEETVAYNNEFCDESKTSFDIVDNKYKFKADFGFFKTNEDWIEWLELGRESYDSNASEFKKKMHIINPLEVIKNLGDEPEWTQEEEWPVNQQGEKLKFICQAWSGDFVTDFCEQEMYLFYDATNKVAVQVHQAD